MTKYVNSEGTLITAVEFTDPPTDEFLSFAPGIEIRENPLRATILIGEFLHILREGFWLTRDSSGALGACSGEHFRAHYTEVE